MTARQILPERYEYDQPYPEWIKDAKRRASEAGLVLRVDHSSLGADCRIYQLMKDRTIVARQPGRQEIDRIIGVHTT